MAASWVSIQDAGQPQSALLACPPAAGRSGALPGLGAPEQRPGQNGQGTGVGGVSGNLPYLWCGFGAGSSGVVPAGMEPWRSGTGHVNRESVAESALSVSQCNRRQLGGPVGVPEFRIVFETFRHGDWWPGLL